MTSVLDRTFWKLRPTLVVSHHSIVCLSRPIHLEVREYFVCSDIDQHFPSMPRRSDSTL